MRKLLVASQKGGVGKTTTSMNLAAAAAQSGTRVLLLDADPLSNISSALNLAEHPHRQSLRQAGIDLPGVMVTNFVPGLDVLCPYEERCSDTDLASLLQTLSALAVLDCYGCAIVDVPPFLGANPEPLIASCDEFLLVMRAEAMAYRTLPAFLELVQRSSREGHSLDLCGILLTLPEGEEPGGRWERELRGRIGSRILPEVIPYDDTIAQALRVGQISCVLHPDSPAARSYRQLVGKLDLAAEARPAAAAEQILEVLRQAAASVRLPTATPPVAGTTDSSSPLKAAREEVDLIASAREPQPVKPPAPSSRVRRLARSGESHRPVRLERPSSSVPIAPSTRLNSATVGATPSETTPTVAPVSPTANANALAQLWPLWILLGAVLGGGLRFLPQPPTLLPVLIGLGVALMVAVALRTMAVREEAAPASAEGTPDRASKQDTRASSGRSETRKERAARLGINTSKKARRDPQVN